jgi:hypothetical protein
MSVEASKLRGANLCTTAVALALAGGVTTTTTTATAQFSIGGLAFTKAAMAGVATPTTDAVTGVAFPALAINTGTVFVFCLDATGALKVVQGTVTDLDSGGNFKVSGPQFPDIPDTLCPFGYAVVKNGATGSNWTFGTSNWNATGITIGAHDVHSLPKLPQKS